MLDQRTVDDRKMNRFPCFLCRWLRAFASLGLIIDKWTPLEPIATGIKDLWLEVIDA